MRLLSIELSSLKSFRFVFGTQSVSGKRGFTLIELLVVVSIIGLLASIVLVSLQDARAKARDTKRIAELQQVRRALELYHLDKNTYPCEVTTCAGQPIGANGRLGEGAPIDALLAPYLPKIPVDPLGPGHATYYYYYDGAHICNGIYYPLVFAANLEKQTGNKASQCNNVWGTEGRTAPDNSYNILFN